MSDMTLQDAVAIITQAKRDAYEHALEILEVAALARGVSMIADWRESSTEYKEIRRAIAGLELAKGNEA